MERKARWETRLIAAAAMWAAIAAGQSATANSGQTDRARIAPITSQPAGQTYGRWAAEWWQWVSGIPAAVNPNTDTTGQHCAQRQVDSVWFLAGSFAKEPVVRRCTIPAGKSLFFPLVNGLSGAFLNDPPEQRTQAYLRENARCKAPATISVKIDGVPVPNPTRYFTGASGSRSPIFNVQLPPGNVYNLDEETVPELVFSPSAEQGYYLFVHPLSPGMHTIRWTASGCSPGFSQDITYKLKVVAGQNR